MTTGIVYLHRFPNGKGYVGKTVRTLMTRTLSDFSGYKTQQLLWRAVQKYGVDSIKTDILHKDVPEPCLKVLEQIEILRYQTHESQNGYNVAPGGDGWDSNEVTRLNNKRVADGTHHMLGENNPSRQRVADGTHHWLGRTWRDHQNATPETRAAWEDADEIVRLHFQGIHQRSLGKMYGVCHKTIGNIIKATVANSQPKQLMFLDDETVEDESSIQEEETLDEAVESEGHDPKDLDEAELDEDE